MSGFAAGGLILSQPSADSSLCGGSLLGPRLRTRWGVSSVMRFAHDSSFCGGSQGDFASAEARRWLSDRPRHPFGHLLINGYLIQRWQVAAALSAAVTTIKFIGDAPNSQAEPTKKKGSSRTPAALRERGSGGEALLLEKRPLPQNLPPPPSCKGD